MKKKYSLGLESEKVYKQKLIAKTAKIIFSLLIVIFSIVYFLLYVLNSKGNFIVSLDKNAENRKNIFLSEDGNPENIKIELSAESLDYMDNISQTWIDKDVDTQKNGSHNGTNYIAYTFYVLNIGKETVNYWYQININDSIKGVDEAVRIKVYRNGKPTVYAKKNKETGKPENETIEFYSEDIAVLEKAEKFVPGDKDRFTIVIWLEGDDPECVDNIIGGEVKLQMDITEEHTGSGNK